MTDPFVRADRPGTREMLYGLLVVGGLVALAIIGSAFLLASTACGCTEPADLVMVNRSSTPATIDWEAGGILGTPLLRTRGHADAPACQATGISLDHGQVTAFVGAGAPPRTNHMTVTRSNGQPAWYVVVDSRGVIGDPVASAPPGADGASLCP